MSIARGATISNIFTVPVDLTAAVAMYVTYQQGGRTVLEKKLADCEITATTITVDLSQEETLKFIENKAVKIQIRAKLPDGSAHKSNVIETTADELLKEGVI